MQTEVVIAGFGGQGVLFAGQLLAYAGMDAGLEVTWIPSYGPEMRGGTANCTVVISDRPVGSPVIQTPRALLAMNLPSLDKFEPHVRPGGAIVVNTSLINRPVRRDDVLAVGIPANELALELGNPRCANIIALGAFVGATDVLPNVDKIEMRRHGTQRWLAIAASPEQVWFKVVDFWQQNGILLPEQDPTTGVMRTAWVENRADIKSDFVTDAVRSVFDGLYSASTRDQFRVRIERGDKPGTTELYLTHFGMEQEIKRGTSGTSEQEVWVTRPTDPNLEAEMLRRIMVHLGASDRKAQQELSQKAAAVPVAIGAVPWRRTGSPPEMAAPPSDQALRCLACPSPSLRPRNDAREGCRLASLVGGPY